MLSASTIKLLRIPFSFFLSPVYFFALAQVPHIDWSRAILIFIILHFLIYPASNGYNSYMDRDTGSIGGLEKPPPPSRQLYLTTIFLDIAGLSQALSKSLRHRRVSLSGCAVKKPDHRYRRLLRTGHDWPNGC